MNSFITHRPFPVSRAKTLAAVCMAVLVSCGPELPFDPSVRDWDATFLAFGAESQTLPTAVRFDLKHVAMEVERDADVTAIKPEFDVPEGYEVLVGNEVQQSGVSTVNFSAPVEYSLKNLKTGQITPWEVHVVPLTCKILVDASHDGGVWWFPQGENGVFDQNQPHQGEAFAATLREKGFEVDELGRNVTLTDEMFFGYYIVIRATGWKAYTSEELDVYDRLLERGMNLALFADHMHYDPADELAEHLGIKFEGVADGVVTNLAPHELTEGITQLDYAVGSVVVNDTNPQMEVLGRLRATDYGDLNADGSKQANEPFGPAVMGVLNYPNSRIFFMGDTNTFQFQPQPFVDNLVRWMGMCE